MPYEIKNYLVNRKRSKELIKDINKTIIGHVVLGVHSNNFYDIINSCLNKNIHLLFLGPKKVGFGKDYQFSNIEKELNYIKLKYNNKINKNSLAEFQIKMFSVDTEFVNIAKKLNNFFEENDIPSELIASEEGKFSMYIDCVENKMGKSSFCDKNLMDNLELEENKFIENWNKY